MHLPNEASIASSSAGNVAGSTWHTTNEIDNKKKDIDNNPKFETVNPKFVIVTFAPLLILFTLELESTWSQWDASNRSRTPSSQFEMLFLNAVCKNAYFKLMFLKFWDSLLWANGVSVCLAKPTSGQATQFKLKFNIN